MRGSGKGIAVDYIAEKLYQQGINIWHTVVESLLDNWNPAQTRFQLGDIFSIKKVKH